MNEQAVARRTHPAWGPLFPASHDTWEELSLSETSPQPHTHRMLPGPSSMQALGRALEKQR